jgi:FlaA1/EpsC-like NDP-sugar epimerase
MYNVNILLFNFLKKENFFLLKNRNNGFFKNKNILITGSSGLIGVNLLIFFFYYQKLQILLKKLHRYIKPLYLNF